MIGITGSSGLERRRFIRLLGALGAATAGGGLASGCGSGNRSDRGPGGAKIRIGYLTPTTGALASYGAADRFVIGAMRQFFAQNPIRVGGRSYPVEILDRDSQSNADRAADLTDDLIANGGIQLMLVSAGAQTSSPVSDRCEANGLPCVSTAAPWQPWFSGRAGRPDTPLRWTYHFFWGLDDVEAVYADMWDRVGTNHRCAGLWPDDADGRTWGDPTSGFPAAQTGRGYDFIEARPFATGNQNFSRLIGSFVAADPDVLVGVPDSADFSTFWKQAGQLGFRPKIATIGRALAFPFGVEALGELGVDLATEVWWSPQHPFTSSLTGQNAQQLADAFTLATGKQWTQPLGFAHALFEVAARAFGTANAIDDRAGLAAAISRMKIDTVVGPLDWTAGPVPNVALTPLVGGQWRTGTSNPFELTIVSNERSPDIPAAGEVRPLGSVG